MPTKSLNYTGRQPIKKGDIRITITSDVFDMELSVGGYDLPDDACVYVEPYRQQHRRHISFGTIGNIITPHANERKIDGPLSPEIVQFRLKVVDQEGKILANVTRIKPEHDDVHGPKSFLHIMSEDTDGECWRVVFDDEEFPVLKIHQDLGDWRHVAKTPYFKAFVYPAILRQVLTHILLVSESEPEKGVPFHYWLVFGREHAGRNWPILPADNHDEVADWVDDAVDSFARRRVQALRNAINLSGN